MILPSAVCSRASTSPTDRPRRQWVTVQLSRMQARGIIRYDRGQIVILNLRALDLELV